MSINYFNECERIGSTLPPKAALPRPSNKSKLSRSLLSILYFVRMQRVLWRFWFKVNFLKVNQNCRWKDFLPKMRLWESFRHHFWQSWSGSTISSVNRWCLLCKRRQSCGYNCTHITYWPGKVSIQTSIWVILEQQNSIWSWRKIEDIKRNKMKVFQNYLAWKMGTKNWHMLSHIPDRNREVGSVEYVNAGIFEIARLICRRRYKKSSQIRKSALQETFCTSIAAAILHCLEEHDVRKSGRDKQELLASRAARNWVPFLRKQGVALPILRWIRFFFGSFRLKRAAGRICSHTLLRKLCFKH